MNTRNQTRWTVTLAAVALTLMAACGTETAAVPTDVGGAGDAGYTPSETGHNDNPARLDFNDNGRG